MNKTSWSCKNIYYLGKKVYRKTLNPKCLSTKVKRFVEIKIRELKGKWITFAKYLISNLGWSRSMKVPSLIVDSILKILVQCLGPRSRKLVMGKTLSMWKFLKIY